MELLPTPPPGDPAGATSVARSLTSLDSVHSLKAEDVAVLVDGFLEGVMADCSFDPVIRAPPSRARLSREGRIAIRLCHNLGRLEHSEQDKHHSALP